MTRSEAIEAFLCAAGWADATRRSLAGDASARTYVRLERSGARAMLMDVPPVSGLTVAPFLAVTVWLRGLGLSAPEVYAADPAAGLVLLEDLGDDLYLRLCTEPAREAELYAAAIDLLVDLQVERPTATPDWTPPIYDRVVLMREMRLAVEWYLPLTAVPAPFDLMAEFEALVEPIVVLALDRPLVPVLRDYHAENLLWLPGRAGPARIGLLDYQDLLIGHPAYDVISLLEDARRDTSPELRAAMLARFVERAEVEPEGFCLAAHALGAQRNLKILGLFVRLARRDGKTGYLRHLPRVWGHLRRDLAHPALAPLAGWIERHLPPPEAALASAGAAP